MSFNKIASLLIMITSITLGFSNSLSAASKINQKSTISNQEMVMIENVAETIAALHNDKSNAVWPEYDPASTPIVLTFNNGHIFAFNLNSSNSAWQKLNVGQSTVLFSDKDEWNVLGIPLQPQFSIDDQIAFVFHFDMMQMDPYLPFLVLVHERFHQHQFSHFSHDKNAMKDAYQDNLNADNLALMQLEELILVDYLKIQGSTAQDNKHKLDVLKDFISVHNARKAVMQPASINWENHQQMMEGLADYISAKTYDVHRILAGFYGDNHLLHTVQGYANDDSISDRAIKWRHYGVGATLGYALDFLNVQDWKEKVQNNGAALDDMLSKALGLSQNESKIRLKEVERHYGYTSVRNKVNTQLIAYQNDIATYMNAFQTAEGISVKLDRPQDVSVSGGGSNQHLYYLEDGGTLAIKESSENRTVDNLWNVSFIKAPVIFQNKNGVRQFKVENELIIKLDGHSFPLKELIAENAEKSFSNISWNGKGSRFQSDNRQGKLIAKDGEVSIKY
jgi:hypothetical protein